MSIACLRSSSVVGCEGRTLEIPLDGALEEYSIAVNIFCSTCNRILARPNSYREPQVNDPLDTLQQALRKIVEWPHGLKSKEAREVAGNALASVARMAPSPPPQPDLPALHEKLVKTLQSGLEELKDIQDPLVRSWILKLLTSAFLDCDRALLKGKP